MEREKRSFYIIGNNPNTIEEAREFLQSGANALEPDIVYADGQFYISHTPQFSYKNIPTLEEYLLKLKALLLDGQYNLALIIWDIKTTNFDPNHFMDVVKENFSGEPFDGIAMLITNADGHAFLNQFNGRYLNVGVGLDESNISPSQVERIFKKANQRNFSYADGITTLLNKTGVYKNITEALYCRNENEPNSFGIIYTWVITRESSMRKYLNTYIDGIMVDIGSTNSLRKLIASPPYIEAYRMAQNGYNPFTAVPIPKYKLSVETKDKLMAGTYAQILFTLTGIAGQSLKSLPFDGSTSGALERGSISYLMLEGIDLGEIKCLSLEAITGGIGADWLPGTITLESQCLKEK
ncbi:MAG: PLAT/LH2 domain-containing protein, partial [Ferruginibacter sp.]